MTKFIAIGLLILLLYNILAHAVAVLIFEKGFSEFSSETNIGENHVLKISIPTLPYTSHWESSDEIEQLVKNGDDFYNIISQRIAHDTLYISIFLLQSHFLMSSSL